VPRPAMPAGKFQFALVRRAMETDSPCLDAVGESGMSLRDVLFELDRANAELHFDGINLKIRAPHSELTEKVVRGLRERKQQIVALLRDGGRSGKVSMMGLLPRPAHIPLSYAQERLWFLEQLGLVGSAYHVAAAVRLDGALDVGALERGIGEVVRRHESLRTRFAAVDGQGIQVIEAARPFRLALDDLSGLGLEAAGAQAQALAQAHAAERFDLAAGPLLRVKLLRLGAAQHVLLVNMHHIVSDGWSMTVMVREIGTLYAAYTAGRSSPLAELTVQYADYALWQRQWLSGEVLERQLQYWKQALAGAPATLELPTDRARPAVQSFAGGAVTFVLSARLSTDLAALGRRTGATLYMVLLAAFALLLSRYSGQHDIVVGTPIAGRRHREVEHLIGFFVNTLALRLDLTGDPGFEAFLARVRETALGAYAHQDLPFEKLVEELNPPRDLSRQPLFQTLFSLQNLPTEQFRLPALELSPVQSKQTTTKFDLSLYFQEMQQGLVGTIEYATTLFERATIDRLATHFERLLQGIVANPASPLSQLKEAMAPFGLHIVVSSTFTAEPLIEALRSWCERIGLTVQIGSTGYNQVLQSIFADRPIVREAHQSHVILLRLEDWGKKQHADRAIAARSQYDETRRLTKHPSGIMVNIDEIERNAEDFISQLKLVAASAKASYLIGLCPSSTGVLVDARQALSLGAIEARLSDVIDRLPGAQMLPITAVAAALGINEIYDPYLDEIAGIPYTDSFFTTVATAVLRTQLRARTRSYKVIIVDCDNTLWQGLCGEDGCHGVRVTSGRRLLQEFLVRQARNGVLVGLCSRNNESDVFDVFQSNPDMILSLDDVVAHRIGWGPKPAAIVEIATELGLALESFVFIDDDPAECALMEAQSPGVLTLQVPVEDDRVNDFLARLWAFDGAGRTDEDRKRTRLYGEERNRSEIRQRSKSLQEFIASLELHVTLREATESDSDRIAQIAERTTQFNTTGLRPSRGGITEILSSKDRSCLVVEVEDRFGDYGLTGLLLSEQKQSSWTIALFALSCRVLGRDVEFRVIEMMAERAMAAGVPDLAFEFLPSARNTPARQFLQDLRSLCGIRHPLETVSAVPVALVIRGLERRRDRPPDGMTAVPSQTDHPAASRVAQDEIDLDAVRRRFYRSVLDAPLGSAQHAGGAHATTPTPTPYESKEYVAPRSATETTLVSIWQELLKVNPVGINDDFFQVGGHSLLATRVAARLRDAFQIELPLRTLFEAPTISELAERVDTIRWAAQRTIPTAAAIEHPDYDQGLL
jgi:FkbH-like protein